ncbi:MAG: cysteine desulfurase family protein [Clostridia bacterium]
MQVYLDNSATTRPCDESVQAMLCCMRDGFYNPSALYAPAMHAEQELGLARQAVANALDANEKNVIFTSCGTESDNLAIFGLLQGQRGEGEILYSQAEHAAVRNACAEAGERFGFEPRLIPLTGEGSLDLDALEGMLNARTRLICAMQICNETGVCMPIAEVCALRDRLAPQAAIFVDGVQGFLRQPFSLRRLNVQAYALSGHKIHGPKGVGALVLRDGVRVHPQLMGGGQHNNLRSGTENTAGIAGLRAAVEHYPKGAEQTMRALKRELVQMLAAALPQAVVIGLAADDPMSAGHILSIAFPPVRAETLLHALEADGILVGTGSACSSHKGKRSVVLSAMRQPPQNMDGAIRLSLCPSNTAEEIRYTAEKIIAAVTVLRRFTRR